MQTYNVHIPCQSFLGVDRTIVDGRLFDGQTIIVVPAVTYVMAVVHGSLSDSNFSV